MAHPTEQWPLREVVERGARIRLMPGVSGPSDGELPENSTGSWQEVKLHLCQANAILPQRPVEDT